MVIKTPAGNSTTSPRIVYSALFVLTIVALTVYCKPFVYGLNMALKPAAAPEAITKVELVQNVKDPLIKPLGQKRKRRVALYQTKSPI
jgi:hypothetical protein